jgi:hypothetical protein
MKQSSYVRNHTNPSAPQPIGTLNGDLADSAYRETPPLLVCGKPHADAIFAGPKSHQRDGNKMKKQSVMNDPNCIHVLRSSSPDSLPLLQWPIRTVSVKLINPITGVFKVFSWLPAGPHEVETGPVDEIMQQPTAPPRVEYVVDYTFLCFLGYHRVQF